MGGKVHKAFYLALTMMLIAVSVAQATPPDAGQLLQEQTPRRQLPEPLPSPPEEAEPAAPEKTGPAVPVKGFMFTGHEGLAGADELKAQVADAVGRELTFGELQALADQVTAFLKSKGWFLARAYLPRQDVTDGIIEIAVLQGTSDGSLDIERGPKVRIRETVLRRIGQAAVRPGKALQEQPLERAVLLMNDLPGVSARASLTAGDTPGSTGVQIHVSEGPLVSGALGGDNYGNRYTGAWRGNSLLNLNDPFGHGDQLSLLLTGAEGLTQGRAAYFFPLHPGGLKGRLAYTGMRYKLIDDLASLDGRGKSHIFDAGLSYPLLRSRLANVTLKLDYAYKTLADRILDTDVSDKDLQTVTLGASGGRYDALFGGGYSTWEVSATQGHLDESIADIRITGAEGSFSRFNWSLARLQRLADRLTLNVSWSAQLALDNLDSSEKFTLGGPYGVRAYPVGEGSGDEGHLFNLDLRYDVPAPSAWGHFLAYAFFDAGQITLHDDPWPNAVATATDKNRYWLKGAGVGLNYSRSPRASVSAIWARTIGENPGRSVDGKDADGRSLDNRFWLQVMIYF